MRQFRHFLIPSVTLFLCSIFILNALAQERLPQIFKKIEPSIVVILTYDKDGKMIGQGSGFFISQSGDIITNRHVLTGVHHAEVKTARGKVYPITLIVAEDKGGDIIRASVNIPKESVHPLSLSSSIPETGERVAVIGSPLGLERTVSDGIVSAVRAIPAFGNIYQITAPISPGSSGSPVVNMKGEVIGVATFQFVEGQNLNFAIPSERIAKLKTQKGKALGQREMVSTEGWLASAERLYNAGLFFYWAEDYEKALPYFEKAVNSDPEYHDYDAFLYFHIGYCNYRLGRYLDALVAFERAARIKPDFAEAYYNVGMACEKLGYWFDRDMLQAFKQAIRIKPDYAEAHYSLGWVYGKQERYAEAIEAFKQAIRIKPDYAEAHYNLGLSYLYIGDKGSALEQYKILKNLDTDSANQLFNLIYK